MQTDKHSSLSNVQWYVIPDMMQCNCTERSFIHSLSLLRAIGNPYEVSFLIKGNDENNINQLGKKTKQNSCSVV